MLTVYHKSAEAYTTDMIAILVIQLWGPMAGYGGIVTRVVADEMDIEVIRKGIIAKIDQTDPSVRDDTQVMSAGGDTTWDRVKGHIHLVTYGQLRKMLAQGQPEVNLFILPCLGAREYTIDMVTACLDLDRWAMGVGWKQRYEIYTLSTTRSSIYKRAWNIRQIQSETIIQNLPHSIITIQQFRSILATLAQEPQDVHNADMPHIGRSAVVFASTEFLRENMGGLVDSQQLVTVLRSAASGESRGEWMRLLDGTSDDKVFQVGMGVGLIPPVRDLDMVLVCHSEVRYTTRVRSRQHNQSLKLGFVLPENMTIGALPENPETSPAFTGDLAALLLHLHEHPRERVTAASLPIHIPISDPVLYDYTDRLVAQGLLCSSGPNAHQLTPRGRLVETLRTQHSIGSLNAACLIACALEQPLPLEGRQGVRTALIVRLASGNQDALDKDMFFTGLEMEARGSLSHLAKRGPIWTAASIWISLETSIGLWIDSPADDLKGLVLDKCGGALSIRPESIGVFRQNLGKIQQAVTAIAGAPCMDLLPKPHDTDVHFIEEVMLHAWANNEASIPTSPDYVNGTGPFAWDITSGQKLERPIDDFVPWDSLLTPQEMESRQELIAVYTHAQQRGQSYIPRDLIFVSRPSRL